MDINDWEARAARALTSLKQQQETMDNYHPDKCEKPHCKCVEIAEGREGGPVKNYPCLAKQASDLLKKKKATAPEPHPLNEWQKAFINDEIFQAALDKYLDDGINYGAEAIRNVPYDDVQQFAADCFHAGALYAIYRVENSKKG